MKYAADSGPRWGRSSAVAAAVARDGGGCRVYDTNCRRNANTWPHWQFKLHLFHHLLYSIVDSWFLTSDKDGNGDAAENDSQPKKYAKVLSTPRGFLFISAVFRHVQLFAPEKKMNEVYYIFSISLFHSICGPKTLIKVQFWTAEQRGQGLPCFHKVHSASRS